MLKVDINLTMDYGLKSRDDDNWGAKWEFTWLILNISYWFWGWC